MPVSSGGSIFVVDASAVGIAGGHGAESNRQDGANEAHAIAIPRGAIHVVFGTPFLFCLFLAVRGYLWVGSHRVLGDAVGRSFYLIWAITACLGSLWLGVSLMLHPVQGRRAAGALLVLTALFSWR
jgi:hypothetical protein